MSSRITAVFALALACGAPATSQIKRLDPLRKHVLLRLDRWSSAEDFRRFKYDGVVTVAPVPGRGILVSIPNDMDLSGVPMEDWAPGRKISPLLARPRVAEARNLVFVAEFHPGTESGEMRTIALREGIEIVQHPDLPNRLLLARGDWRQVEELSRWDEVAYLFPASAELIASKPVEFCDGPLTALGRVGQYLDTVGPGWDGPGQGSASLTYSLELSGVELAPEQVRNQIERALSEWSRYVRVEVAAGGQSSAHRNVNILFAPGDHGDPYPFDGPGKILAHAFYPAPPNPEPLAGDVHLDGDESWDIGFGHDIFSVVLHELGHALGLGHSDDPGAVMYPHYRLVEGLSRADALAIQRLYASAAPPPPAAFAVNIDQPVDRDVTTDRPTLRVSGTVTGGEDKIEVSWRSSAGQRGEAAGGRIWVVPELPLQPGENVVTLTAWDSSGLISSAQLTVYYHQPSGPPEIEIEWPMAEGVYETQNDSVLVSGRAAHASGILSVVWLTSGGAGGTATGTTWWSAGMVPLRRGVNQVTITAEARNKETASVTLQVNRVDPAPQVRRSPSGGRGRIPGKGGGR